MPHDEAKADQWLPRISMGLNVAQLSARLRRAKCGGQVHSVKPWRLEDVLAVGAEGMKQYPCPNPKDLAATGYNPFEELEDDPLVLFHGTTAERLRSITVNGFNLDKSALKSISFVEKSNLALSRITRRRSRPGATSRPQPP